MSDSKTPWQETQLPEFPTLKRDTECDVLIVGGGITGLTAAYLLNKAKKRVIVVDRGRLAGGDTGCTTAHLTQVTDLRLRELVDSFGRDTARLVWEGGAAAINTIEKIVGSEDLHCEFQRIPGFLHASLTRARNEAKSLNDDCDLANELGFAATFVGSVPGLNRAGVRFANQAKFHPLQYLAGIARALDKGGCRIFEQSEASQFEEKPRAVIVKGKRIKCDHIVIATHVPLMGELGLVGATLFQSKLAPYSSYAIGAKIPKGALPEASFWDTSDPYYYLRVDARSGSDYAIFGGEDHKTGQAADTKVRFARLEQLFKTLVPQAKVNRRWSGQVVETHDGLPYIGETAAGQFAATGFSGNGMTLGTLAGMMACDWLLGRTNPWQSIFHPSRKKVSGLLNFVKESFDYPYYLLRDRLTGSNGASTRAIPRGEGRVLEIDGQRVACSRDDNGKLCSVSAVCTHMGCIVHWNNAEGTWDCPCHGSRFLATGEVLAGPAEAPLDSVPDAAAKSAKTEKTKPQARMKGRGQVLSRR
ncbi:MAG: FAD-dependent oxidoreductase [Planctomycetia bacterium]|nr:FAD-dependent oxidoreductase [Planctomycetia bacterium]